jgi:hypothetical protein
MAPLRHLAAKVLVGRNHRLQGAIHERDHDGRLRFGEACFPGTRGRCRGSDGSAQAAATGAVAGILQPTIAVASTPGCSAQGPLAHTPDVLLDGEKRPARRLVVFVLGDIADLSGNNF